jgi:hypothetical protein
MRWVDCRHCLKGASRPERDIIAGDVSWEERPENSMDATQAECAEKSAMASCVSLAYSGARFGNAVLAGLGGQENR